MGRYQFSINKKKTIRRRRIFWFVAFPILLIASLGISYGAYLYKKAETVMGDSYHADRVKSDLRDKKVDPNIDNVSVLFIGIDGSEKRGTGDHTRSDALMLATLNEKEKSVKLLSIPRDSYVYIKEVGYSTKINHAHSYGGPKATIETVEDLLDIPVDYYVRLDFNAFMKVVDALGGIDVEVPYTFSEQNSKDKAGAIKLEEGMQTLDGEQALALARTRKLDSDLERGKRQQEIMKAIVKKAASGTSVLKYSQVIEAIGSSMLTNMTFDEMKAFIDYGISGNLNIETLQVAGADSYIPNSSGNNVYYYQLDEEALAELKGTLKQHLDVASHEPPSHTAGPSTEN
ncbi:LCP family protein [Lederbergia citrea]|uniref:LCP family protein n=1 Tax=Lederbergia citrea TaxID=2833581 RepID=A0A942UV10_9BACI|nr:LCP family protein [Lederbergia citrea]MBS4204763.1 LCP family protein [Lederbergia citrea]MBS4223389.1 LCP family protein [Lederbergia citrea]